MSVIHDRGCQAGHWNGAILRSRGEGHQSEAWVTYFFCLTDHLGVHIVPATSTGGRYAPHASDR